MKKILELKTKVLTRKEIGEKSGFSAEQIHSFTKRYNKKQLQYELTMKERHIKRLEMENDLMWDFLSLTERK